MDRLSIIKAPAGIGKTSEYIEEKLGNDKSSKLVAAPTNELKNEIYNKIVAIFGAENVMETPILAKLKDKEIQEEIERLDKMGLYISKKKYLFKMKKELEAKENLTSREEADLKKITEYLDKNEQVNQFEGHIVTTHERLCYFGEETYNTHKIIIDEDPIKTMLKIRRISMEDLMKLSSSSIELMGIFGSRIIDIANAPYQQTIQMPEISTSQDKIEKAVNDEHFNFDVIGFAKSCCFLKYNPNKEIMENDEILKEGQYKPFENINDEIYFLEIKEFPSTDIAIFSATIEPLFYRQLLGCGFDIKEYDIGEVKLKR